MGGRKGVHHIHNMKKTCFSQNMSPKKKRWRNVMKISKEILEKVTEGSPTIVMSYQSDQCGWSVWLGMCSRVLAHGKRWKGYKNPFRLKGLPTRFTHRHSDSIIVMHRDHKENYCVTLQLTKTSLQFFGHFISGSILPEAKGHYKNL